MKLTNHRYPKNHRVEKIKPLVVDETTWVGKAQPYAKYEPHDGENHRVDETNPMEKCPDY